MPVNAADSRFDASARPGDDTPGSLQESGKSFRALTGSLDTTVGMVACIRIFGNFAGFPPHLHILVTDGGFGPNGAFHVLPKVSLSGLEQLFRHRVLKMMLRAGPITPRGQSLSSRGSVPGFTWTAPSG